MSVAKIDLPVSRSSNIFCYNPSTLDEALKYAEIVASSGLCPDAYKGKPKDILIATQMGAEIGLKWLQALRCIGVVNGRPFIWGDGLFFLAKKDRNYKDSKEWLEGSIEQNNLTAYCQIDLVNGTSVIRKFSQADAIRAGLWNKINKNGTKSVWASYPERMLQMRARGFCCRDAVPGAFFNLLTEDEVINIEDNNHKSTLIKGKGVNGLAETLGVNDQDIEDAVMIDKPESDIEKLYIDPNEPPLTKFKRLIKEANIKNETVHSWCKKANVKTIDDMSMENINKGINFLEGKKYAI